MGLTLTLAIVAFFLIVAWILRRRFWEHQFLARNGIPGPKPDLIMGNFLQLKKDRVQVMSNWFQKYGKYFGYYYGRQPIVVCSDLDTIRQILVKDSANFIDRSVSANVVEPYMSSLVFLKGEEWKKIRNAMTPSFSAAKMRLMTPIMQSSIDIFIDILRKKAGTGETFDIINVAQGLTLDVICKCALAMNVDCQHSETGLRMQVREFFENIEKDYTSLSWSFPLFHHVFGLLYELFGAGSVMKSILSNLSEAIARRRRGENPNRVDLLQLLLDAQKSLEGMTDKHVIANAFVVLIGGYETTATAIGYVSMVLAERPDVQDRIIEEIRRIHPAKVAQDQKLTYEELNDLKYLSCVVNEVLRLYPPAILFVTRYCSRTCNINGFNFPAGVHVTIPVYQIHHDPEIWEAPDEFRPERFSTKADRQIHPAQFLPFGSGPRMCIGMRFAMLEIKMAIVEMLKNIRLKPGEGFQSPPEFVVPTVVINPKDGVKVCAELVKGQD